MRPRRPTTLLAGQVVEGGVVRRSRKTSTSDSVVGTTSSPDQHAEEATVTPVAKKAGAKKAPAKKAPAKKTVAKKTVAKKAPARKTAAKKTVAKKAPARKTAAKKTVAKKAPARKKADRQEDGSEEGTGSQDRRQEDRCEEGTGQEGTGSQDRRQEGTGQEAHREALSHIARVVTGAPLRRGTGASGDDSSATPRLGTLARHGCTVHLHHAQGESVPSTRPRGAEGHQPLLLPGRQDRRDRGQRVGQVLAAADHGRHRRRLHRRRPPEPRLHRRAARAGAAARRRARTSSAT